MKLVILVSNGVSNIPLRKFFVSSQLLNKEIDQYKSQEFVTDISVYTINSFNIIDNNNE